jgi:hypothetical protein
MDALCQDLAFRSSPRQLQWAKSRNTRTDVSGLSLPYYIYWSPLVMRRQVRYQQYFQRLRSINFLSRQRASLSIFKAYMKKTHTIALIVWDVEAPADHCGFYCLTRIRSQKQGVSSTATSLVLLDVLNHEGCTKGKH